MKKFFLGREKKVEMTSYKASQKATELRVTLNSIFLPPPPVCWSHRHIVPSPAWNSCSPLNKVCKAVDIDKQ